MKNNTLDLFEKMKPIEKILYILMNLFGPPAMQIVFGLLWGWIGLIISLILFFVFFISWKYISKSEGILSFSPTFTFGTKKYKI
jgi:hypothetical protein